MRIRVLLLEDFEFEGVITLRWSQKVERGKGFRVNAVSSFSLLCQSNLDEECSIGDVGSLPANSD